MSPFREVYTQDQIRDITAYVVQVLGKQPPAR